MNAHRLRRGEWVKFWSALCEGDKRGLPRATRFIFLELSLKARKLRGDIVLPIGMTDHDAVHDLIGGNRRELEVALGICTKPIDPTDPTCRPMLRFHGPKERRILTVESWQEWNAIDDSSERVEKFRAKKRESVVTSNGGNGDGNDDVTRYQTVSNAAVTPLEKRREEEEKKEKKNPTGSKKSATEAPPSETRPATRKAHRLPADWTASPALIAWSHEQRIDGARHVDEFRDYWHAKPGQAGTKLDWDAAFRTWVRNASKRGDGHPWSPPPQKRVQTPVAAEDGPLVNLFDDPRWAAFMADDKPGAPRRAS